MVFVTYVEYLSTTGWRVRSHQAMERANWRCEMDATHDGPLQVHHLTYARVGRERDDDLIVLCDECHARHHGLVDEGVDQLPLPFHETVH